MPSNQMRDQLIAQNIELLSRIHNTKWHKYTQGERIKALQAVADIEQAYLGLSGQLTIVPDTLNMGGTMAYYSPEDNTITVDKNAIMSVLAAESLKVICHEAYHGYEYALINALQTVDDSASLKTRNCMNSRPVKWMRPNMPKRKPRFTRKPSRNIWELNIEDEELQEIRNDWSSCFFDGCFSVLLSFIGWTGDLSSGSARKKEDSLLHQRVFFEKDPV